MNLQIDQIDIDQIDIDRTYCMMTSKSIVGGARRINFYGVQVNVEVYGCAPFGCRGEVTRMRIDSTSCAKKSSQASIE